MDWKLEPAALQQLEQALRQSGLSEAGPSSTALTVPEAQRAIVERIAPICELLYLMMVVDGICGLEERQVLIGAARTLSGGRLSSEVIAEMLLEFEARQRTLGAQQQLESVAAWLSSDRMVAEAAFTMTAAMAVADERVDPLEQDLLREVAELLGIPARRARRLLGAVSHGPDA